MPVDDYEIVVNINFDVIGKHGNIDIKVPEQIIPERARVQLELLTETAYSILKERAGL